VTLHHAAVQAVVGHRFHKPVQLNASAPHVRLRRQQLHLVPPVLHHHAKDVRSELHPGTRHDAFLAILQLQDHALAVFNNLVGSHYSVVKSNAAAAVLPAHSARLARCTHMRHAVEQGPRHVCRRAQCQQPQQLPACLTITVCFQVMQGETNRGAQTAAADH